MKIEQRIIEALHCMTPAQQEEVLDFVGFLRYKAGSSPVLKMPAQPDKENMGDEVENLPPLPVLVCRVPEEWKDAVYDHS